MILPYALISCRRQHGAILNEGSEKREMRGAPLVRVTHARLVLDKSY